MKRYKNAKQIIESNNGLPVVNRYDIVYFAALMIYFLSYNPYSKMEYVVHKIEKTNPDIYLLAEQLYESITNIGFDTPEKSFRCLSDMFTKFDIWNIQAIGYKNITFFNASEVEAFLSQNSITWICSHYAFLPQFLLQQTRKISTHPHKKYTHNTQLKRKPH